MFEAVRKAIAEIRAGKMVIVTDDRSRENEGDLIMAASLTTPERVNFMISRGRGLVCVAIMPERATKLALEPQTTHNTSSFQTNFTISVDKAMVGQTGISAQDRCETIRALASQRSTQATFHRPGHVFPLLANAQGVLGRQGHTEAAVDLARLAGLPPAGALCEILNKRGLAATASELTRFAKQERLAKISIAELRAFRLATEQVLVRTITTRLPTRYGNFKLHLYRDQAAQAECVALVLGRPKSHTAVLVRIQSSCLTGEVLYSERCDCRGQLDKAMEEIAKTGNGVVIYLAQEGRGIGLGAKLAAYALQDRGLDTVEANERLGFAADQREFYAAAHILKDLKLTSITLLTNNPQKLAALQAAGLVVKRHPLWVAATRYDKKYLQTKIRRLGHLQ